MTQTAAVEESRDDPDLLERHRTELAGYCYRMLGSAFEADDAVQETMVRAWRGLDRFEGRSALRTWLYTIATRVCLDMLQGRQRRARPMEIGRPRTPEDPIGSVLDEATWVTPVPDGLVLPVAADPAETAVLRDSIRLAFVAALQHLPPRQRAVLILREVLQWRAAEVAELLGDSVASVNSALQRARATLTERQADTGEAVSLDDERQRELVDRYVDAFERYDMATMVVLLHEDATLSMPPYPLWIAGPQDIVAWLVGHGAGCRGSRVVRVEASGAPAFAQYRLVDGQHTPWAIQVLEIEDGKIVAINAFLDTERLFPMFGLPAVLPAAG